MNEKEILEDFYLEKREEEIDLFEIIEKLWKGKKIIAIFILIGFLLSLVGGSAYKKKNTLSKTYISLNYDGISEGKNPDGSNFNRNNLITDLVMNKAYYEYNKLTDKPEGITRFKYFIDLVPIIPKNISVLIEKNLKNGIAYSYNPQQYAITFKGGLDNKKNNRILENLVNNIIENFTREYKPYSNILEIDEEKIFEIEKLYEDYIFIIDNRIENIVNNIETSSSEKMKFKTSKLSYTYQDILSNLELIKKIDLSKIRSVLELKYISLDVKQSTLVTDNQILDLKSEKEILSKRAEVLSEILEQYKMSQKEILFSVDMKTSLAGKDEYYAKLIDDYVTTSTKIKENEVEINRLKNKVASMVSSTEESNQKIIKDFKKVIRELNLEISKLNNLDKEYYELKYSEMIKQISPVESLSTGKPLILIIAVGIILFGILGCVFVLGKSFIDNHKKK